MKLGQNWRDALVINKRLVGKLYRRRIRSLDLLNLNADFNRWAERNAPKKVFKDRGAGRWEYPDGSLVRMHAFVNAEASGSAGIDFFEFGVFEGRSLNIFARLNDLPDTRFYGFDSFEGLPEYWSFALGGLKRDAFSLNGKAPELSDSRIQLIKGLFQHTLVDFLAGYKAKKNLVIHMDADLYSSTLYCLATLDPVLDGAIVIFAAFDNLSHEYSAFQDYVRSFRRSYEVIARYGYYKKVVVRFGPSAQMQTGDSPNRPAEQRDAWLQPVPSV